MLDINKLLGLDKIEKLISRFEHRPLRIYADQCLSCRGDKQGLCRRCMVVCPVDAIDLKSGSPEVDFNRCNECGLCAGVCPAAVFECVTTEDFLLAKIKETAGRHRTLIFRCQKLAATLNDHRAEVEVSCLGRLNEALLLGGATFGAETIWLDNSICSDCGMSQGESLAAATAHNTSILIKAFGGKTEIIVVSPEIGEELTAEESQQESEVGSFSRRDFIDQMRRQVMIGGAELIEGRLQMLTPAEKEKQSSYNYRLPRSRELLLALLRKLGVPEDQFMEAGDLPFRQLQISSACNACGNCATLCPTQALIKEEKDKSSGLAFSLANCTGCDLCITLCPVKAITSGQTIDAWQLLSDERLELAGFGKYSCRECQQPFDSIAKADICPFCLLRREKLGDMS